MSGPFGSSQWMYSSGGGFYPYEIDQSLRFNDNDSPRLARTPSSAGNRKTWTWSGWYKRGNLGVGHSQSLIASSTSSTNIHYAYIGSGEIIGMYYESGGGTIKTAWSTSALFRDPSAWYHIVLTFDTTKSNIGD